MNDNIESKQHENENNNEPKLLNNDKNIMDEIMKNLDNLKTSDTDMKFEYLANPDKIVSDEKLYLYDNKEQNENNKNELINSELCGEQKKNYIPTESKDYKEQYKSNPIYNTSNPIPSSYGPSYGTGPSYPSYSTDQSIPTNNTNTDKYCGFSSEEELNLARLNMLRKLGELLPCGVKLSQNYNMNSDYKAMQYEYELHKSIRDKHNGIHWLSNLMLNLCWGIELGNENFNPFEFNLKGWSEQMNGDIGEYYDVLGELYEKWVKTGKPIPPEMKLILMIGGSAIKFHIAKTAISKIPSLAQVLKENPSFANKLNEQSNAEKQKTAFEKKSDEQHNIALKQMEDLQMLKEKQKEYLNSYPPNNQNFMQQQMMQQQILQQKLIQQQNLQQKQLEELHKQLNQQRSESHSHYHSNSVYTNKSLKNKNSQKTMNQPIIPPSLKNKFSISTNKQSISKPDEIEYNDALNIGVGAININPYLDNILNEKFNDTQSLISNDSTISKNKNCKKKSLIKIDT